MSTRPPFIYLLTPPRLPSIESQTVAFIEAARAQQQSASSCISCWLKWAGFEVYLRYWRGYTVADLNLTLGETLVIASIELPKRLRDRGWFWRYCQLCCALTEQGVIIETVVNLRLHASLTSRTEFIPFSSNSFFLPKRNWADWPLVIASSRGTELSPRR